MQTIQNGSQTFTIETGAGFAKISRHIGNCLSVSAEAKKADGNWRITFWAFNEDGSPAYEFVPTRKEAVARMRWVYCNA